MEDEAGETVWSEAWRKLVVFVGKERRRLVMNIRRNWFIEVN